MREKTKQKALSILEAMTILFLAYPFGIMLTIWFLAGRLLGRVVLLHKERFPARKDMQKMILISNHPSMADVFLIPSLLHKYFLFSPLRNAPMIVVDRTNFYDSWWFWPLKTVMVPVDRGNQRKQALILLKMKRAIEQGRIVIIFPEGGRTFKGKEGEFLYSRKGNDINGGRIRLLKGGVGLLVQKTGATVLPVGLKDSDRLMPNHNSRLWNYFVPWEKVTINIGEPIRFAEDAGREEITQTLSATLLGLIDEAI